jgi:hypothetical protein
MKRVSPSFNKAVQRRRRRQSQRRFHAAHRTTQCQKGLNYHYQRKYHITLEEFEQRILDQKGLCPIGLHPFGPRGKHKDAPCMDHNHKTGKNRAILCRLHNHGLGHFKDSVVELQQAIRYLQSYEEIIP